MTKLKSAFSVGEVLQASWDMTKSDWRQYLWLGAMSMLAWVALIVVSIGLDMVGVPRFVGSLLSCLLMVQVSIFMLRGLLAIGRKQKLALTELVQFDSRLFIHMLLATLLFYVVVMVGMVLFIVPGIIASLMFGFYMFSLVDKHTDAISSLEDSMHMTEGNKVQIFLFQIVMSLLGGLVVGVPAVIATVLIMGLANGSDNMVAAMVLIGGLAGLIVAIGLAILSMMGMSSQAYMYLQMRAKTPLRIKN